MAQADDQSQKNNDTEDTSRKKPDRVYEDNPSLLVRTEEDRGSRPGDVRVRIVRSNQRSFRRVGAGLLEATEATQAPRTILQRLKRLLIGTPIATAQANREQLTKIRAFAFLSANPISSVAYATEAILITLVAGGSKSLGITLPISIAVVLLLGIVTFSYHQTIDAYPDVSGAYLGVKDNLGTYPGLIAAASLMIDYILTVSVSIAAVAQTLASFFDILSPYIVVIDVVLISLITIVYLRGVRESSMFFAFATYLFVASALLLVIVGSIKSFFIQHQPIISNFQYVAATQSLTIFLILKSVAAGSSALTGVEAFADGKDLFEKPKTRNASITLICMAVILGIFFIGITMLATSYHVEANPQGNPTVITQIAAQVFTGPLYLVFPIFQIATLLILAMAAYTSYANFPQLASVLARDDYLPHQFVFRGDRLAFSSGIICLAIIAGLLLITFKGDTTSLVTLYAEGVFLAFTLSQGGMVRYWRRLRNAQKWPKGSIVLNFLGAILTLFIFLVIAITKFLAGAWFVVVLIPLLVLMFKGIKHHYRRVEGKRTTSVPIHPKDICHRLIVPIAELNLAAKQALAYARSISLQATAVHVAAEREKADALRAAWDEWQTLLPANELSTLDIIDPGRRLPLLPLLDYIDAMHQQHPAETLTVVLPELVKSSSNRLFSSPKVLGLKVTLLFRPDIIVTNVSLREQASAIPTRPKEIHHRFIVPIAGLDLAVVQSLAYARSISQRVIAAHVAIDPHDVEVVRSMWSRFQGQFAEGEETHLVIIESPYRSFARPLLSYIDTVHELHPEDTLTVVLPEFVVAHWWEHPLHNQTAFRLKAALLSRPHIVVTDIPHHL